MTFEPFHHPLSLLYGFLGLRLGETFGAVFGVEDVFVTLFLDHGLRFTMFAVRPQDPGIEFAPTQNLGGREPSSSYCLNNTASPFTSNAAATRAWDTVMTSGANILVFEKTVPTIRTKTFIFWHVIYSISYGWL